MCGGFARDVRGVSTIIEDDKNLPPASLSMREGVLEMVCLSNQVMMSGNICELQGVSR